MIDIAELKAEARRILIQYSNGVVYANALGKGNYRKLLNNNMRVHYIYGMLQAIYGEMPEEAPAPYGYGRLYNWYAATYSDGGAAIAPDGWHVPTVSEFNTLVAELGGDSVAGGHLKEVGTTYWDTSVADNSSSFSGRGSGCRSADDGSVFLSLNQECTIYSTTLYDSGFNIWTNVLALAYDNTTTQINNAYKADGRAIRCIKDDSINDGIVVDIDGNIYSTVKIGDQVWMEQNLIVTHYNDGTPIPEITDNVTWGGLTTGAWCAYDNDLGNIGETVSMTPDTDEPVYYLGDTIVTEDFILTAIERLRHYTGVHRNVSLDDINAEYITPSVPDPTGYGDVLRSGVEPVTVGSNFIEFSTPLPSANYEISAYVNGVDGDYQVDLGTITKIASGFTCGDVLVAGSIHYTAIMHL